MITKDRIIFLDTNVISDIGRLEKDEIRKVIYQISVELKLCVALTPFNIMEIERIPDERVKENVHWLLDILNIVHFKGMIELFQEEMDNGLDFNPIKFSTTLISTMNGKPANFLSLLSSLKKNDEYVQAVLKHNQILEQLRMRFTEKPNITLEKFICLEAKHNPILRQKSTTHTLRELGEQAPAFVSYCCSLYNKIGSKGLRNNPGEMNDNAMSYIFPYVGYIVTEKRLANLYISVRDKGLIPTLINTVILKHSDVISKDNGILKISILDAIRTDKFN